MLQLDGRGFHLRQETQFPRTVTVGGNLIFGGFERCIVLYILYGYRVTNSEGCCVRGKDTDGRDLGKYETKLCAIQRLQMMLESE